MREAAGVAAAAVRIIAQALAAAGADLRVRVDAFDDWKVSVNTSSSPAPFERRVGLVFIFSDDELLGIMQAGHEQVAKLERGIAAGQDRDVNPADLAQVLGGFLLGRLFREGREQ